MEVVLADVVDAVTLPIYRRRLERLLVVRLHVELGEARRRAALRPVRLSPAELLALHQQEASSGLPVDRTIDVTAMSPEQQTAAVSKACS